MSEIKRPINIHQDYHAHLYFENETLELATNICNQVGARFGLQIGTVHQRTVGPHPKWSCQILFSSQHFDELIPWLEANRQGLTVFVHAQTDDDLKDHTEYAYWLGDEVELNLAIFGG